MTDGTSNTLFDRLVTRTMNPPRAIEAPFEPIFERFAEEEEEHLAPPPRSMRQAILDGPLPSAPVRQRVAAPEPEKPGTAARREQMGMMAPAVKYKAAESTPADTRHEPAPRSSTETRIRTIREPHIIERLRVEQQHVSTSSEVEPPEAIVEHPVTLLLPSRLVPTVEPDLPPAIPSQPPTQQKASTSPASAEPIIHVTIGRLEIRAGEKEKPVARRSRKAPGPSLEQYLSKRRGGAP
jgi:hypothetical protein